MPPSGLVRSRPFFTCLFTSRSPSMVMRFALRSIFKIFPRLLALLFSERSAPEMICTVSPTLSFCIGSDPALKVEGSLEGRPLSQHLGREGDDLHELARPQLARDRPKDSRANWLQVLVDQHRGVAVELDEAPIRPAHLSLGADDHRFRHLPLLDLGVGERLADRDHDDVANRSV